MDVLTQKIRLYEKVFCYIFKRFNVESTYQFLRKPPSKKITTFLNFGKIKQAVAPNKHPGNNLKNLICALNADSNFYGK